MLGAVVAESTGKHHKPEPAAEPTPAAEPVIVPVAVPMDVTPDPLAGIRPGDSFLPVPISDPVCGALAVVPGGQVYACTRRPHPDHWWHIRVLDAQVRQLWAGDGPVAEPHGWPTTDPDTATPGIPDPLGHVRVGDLDPEAHVQQGLLCDAPSPSVFMLRDRPLHNTCSRRPHPPHWQHIAGDGDEVVEVWPATTPTPQPAPAKPTPPAPRQADAIIDEIQALLASVSRASQQFADGPTAGDGVR